MHIQPYNSSTSYSYDSLPEEVLLKCFSYLNLDDMPIVERVSTTWNRVSFDDLCWELIAFKRKINLDDAPAKNDEIPYPKRAKAFLSFGPYCKAAHFLFPNEIVPVNLNIVHMNRNAAHGILLIDKNLSCLDISEEKIQHIRENLIEFLTLSLNIPYGMSIPGIQVLLNSKKFTVDELFESMIRGISCWLDYPKIYFIALHTKKTLYTASPFSIANPFTLENIWLARLANDVSPLSKYLSPYVEKPSLDSIFSLCSAYAFIKWMKALENINAVRYEQKDILGPLLDELSGDAWGLAFEKFMHGKNEVDMSIRYPIFIHTLVKKMDETEFQLLFDTSKFLTSVTDQFGAIYDASMLFQISGDKFQDYMIQRMLDGYKQSLLAIRNS